VLCAPSESSASEPEAIPAASLSAARIVLATIEAAAARCFSFEWSSAGGLASKTESSLCPGASP
jgi:hypothetical protein